MIFNIVMIVTATVFLYMVIRGINRNKILLENAFVWLLIGIGMLIFSFFPKVPTWLAIHLGFQVTSNFILFLAVICLLILSFVQSIQLSKLKNQMVHLVQEVSLNRKRGIDNNENEK